MPYKVFVCFLFFTVTSCRTYLYSGKNGTVTVKHFQKKSNTYAYVKATILDMKSQPIPFAVLRMSNTSSVSVSNDSGVLEGHFLVGTNGFSVKALNFRDITFNLNLSAKDSLLLVIRMKVADGVIVE